jgi:cell division septum initiation protein DivIVA
MPRLSLFPVVAVTLLSSVAVTHAGPCAQQISQVEQQIKALQANPPEGPSAPQSVGAQLGRQPTPSTVQRARQNAATLANEVLESARMADSDGDAAACEQALRNLKDIYGII